MVPAVAAICIALSAPATPYAGELPALRSPDAKILLHAASASGFAPRGWTVERAVRGDLNADGRPDLAMVLKGIDPACIVKTDTATGSLDTNPRRVVIAWGTGSGFERRIVNASVISRLDDPYTDDPFESGDMTIRNGVLRLGLSYWRSMGGWTTFTVKLSFRWDGTQARLIGYDRDVLQRNSGETEKLSVDFVTRRVRTVTGSFEGDVTTTKLTRLPPQNPETLATIGDGLAYMPVLKPVVRRADTAS